MEFLPHDRTEWRWKRGRIAKAEGRSCKLFGRVWNEKQMLKIFRGEAVNFSSGFQEGFQLVLCLFF